jgi:hypothetical protein
MMTTIRRGTSDARAFVNDCHTLVVRDHTHLERCRVRRRTDERRHVGIVGLERSPVMSKSVQHVFVGDTVLAGARSDVHEDTQRGPNLFVNRC